MDHGTRTRRRILSKHNLSHLSNGETAVRGLPLLPVRARLDVQVPVHVERPRALEVRVRLARGEVGAVLAVVLDDLRDLDLEVAHLERAVRAPPHRDRGVRGAAVVRRAAHGHARAPGGGDDGAVARRAARAQAAVVGEPDADDEHVEDDRDDGRDLVGIRKKRAAKDEARAPRRLGGSGAVRPRDE